MIHFGQLVKSLRNRARMSQRDLAEVSGLSLSGIQVIERNPLNSLRWGTYRALCNAFGITEDEMDALYRGDVKDVPIKVPVRLLLELEPIATSAGETIDSLVQRVLEDYLDGSKKQRPAPTGRHEDPKVVALPKPKPWARKKDNRSSGGRAAGSHFAAAPKI